MYLEASKERLKKCGNPSLQDRRSESPSSLPKSSLRPAKDLVISPARDEMPQISETGLPQNADNHGQIFTGTGFPGAQLT